MNREHARLMPPEHVLRAFGADGPPTRLVGGRGLAWRAGGIVVKPADASEEALAWQAEAIGRATIDRLRVAPPRPSARGEFIVDGWTASEFLAGAHQRARWLDVIAAGERLHVSLAGIDRPGFLDRRNDRWATADRAAWGEVPLSRYLDTPHVARLAERLAPVDAVPQVIHGDLTGNVLFADRLPPAVVDFAVYWRPPAYASAVVVADALAWEGAGTEDIAAAASGPEFGQMLARALLFRIITDRLASAASATSRAPAYASGVRLAVGMIEGRPVAR